MQVPQDRHMGAPAGHNYNTNMADGGTAMGNGSGGLNINQVEVVL